MTIDDVIKMLNSEDCKLATSICLMRYKERDCWKCILKEYTKTVYNKAIDDFVEKMKYEYGSDEINETIDEIAEELKAGGENE